MFESIGTYGKNLPYHSTYRPRPHALRSLFGRGTSPAKRSVIVFMGIITAAGITAKGNMMPRAIQTGDERHKEGDNGGLQYPKYERGDTRSWSDREEQVGSYREELGDGRRYFSSSHRAVMEHSVEVESALGDNLIVTDQKLRHNRAEDRTSKAVFIREDKEEIDDGINGMPRILTVLTTYNRRSRLVKAYKHAVGNRSDGYRPTACVRYAGQFDWLALGDDDTVFMYNRLQAFLRHIDHTQPVAIAMVDGLDSKYYPRANRDCLTPEQKRNTSDPLASKGCCDDFTHPCNVSVFPEHPEVGLHYTFENYGPGGLFWPYGGSGALVSAGLVETVVGGATGWALCESLFSERNTDVQVAQCLKMHGYTIGSYPDGFTDINNADPVLIKETLSANCQVMGVHLAIKHLGNGSHYTMKSFGDAVAAVQDEDQSGTDPARDLTNGCHKAWAAISKWT